MFVSPQTGEPGAIMREQSAATGRDASSKRMGCIGVWRAYHPVTVQGGNWKSQKLENQ